MSIENVTNINLIAVDLDVNSKKEVITYLAELLYQQSKVESVEKYVEEVMERENHETTGVGKGVAIPHGKSEAVKQSSVAIAKLKNPIEWNSLDGEPVDLVFQLAIKKSDEGDLHLKLLSNIACKLMEDEFINNLRSTSDKEKILKLID
jgi:fructose-specific phosphotransferase system IIA component